MKKPGIGRLSHKRELNVQINATVTAAAAATANFQPRSGSRVLRGATAMVGDRRRAQIHHQHIRSPSEILRARATPRRWQLPRTREPWDAPWDGGRLARCRK